jgi:hypothetical protein
MFFNGHILKSHDPKRLLDYPLTKPKSKHVSKSAGLSLEQDTIIFVVCQTHRPIMSLTCTIIVLCHICQNTSQSQKGKFDVFSSKLVTTWSSIKLSVLDHVVCLTMVIHVADFSYIFL